MTFLSKDFTRAAVGNALPIIGLVAVLGLFLPSLDTSWKADPGNAELRKRIRTGEFMYLTLATGLGLLASYANRNKTPFVLALVWSLTVISMHEYAINHPPRQGY